MRRCLALAVLALAFAPTWHAATPAEKQTLPAQPLPRPEPVGPPAVGAIDGAIDRGVAFLLKDQNKDGSWGSANRTKGLNIYAPVPDAHDAFRAAVTSLCISALIEVGGAAEPVCKAVERGEAWLFERLPLVRRSSADALYNVWTHIYGIQALVKMHERLRTDAARRRKVEDLIRNQIDFLKRFESIDGGWGYYDLRVGAQRPTADSTSFMTAAALVALHEAKAVGVPAPDKLVQRACDSIRRQRKPDYSYLYGEYMKYSPMHPINRPGGSLGRSQACNLALRLWGDERI